jgi:hypothetical protein
VLNAIDFYEKNKAEVKELFPRMRTTWQDCAAARAKEPSTLQKTG